MCGWRYEQGACVLCEEHQIAGRGDWKYGSGSEVLCEEHQTAGRGERQPGSGSGLCCVSDHLSSILFSASWTWTAAVVCLWNL